ncbi:MAG: glycosyltransferase family 9 protein [Desulfovibrionales bacterium]|nr:glycosyltransferase family 9 protein [Desulfovibrionales bacterium]
MPATLANQECLTIRLSALGDAILTTGVLRHWQDHFGLSFHILTRPALAPVFDNHPAVRSVITVEEKDLRGLAWIRLCRSLATAYGRMPFIDLHGTLRTRALRLLWPGPTRAYPKFSFSRRLFLATHHPFFSRRLNRYNVPQRYSLALQNDAPEKSALRPQIVLRENEIIQARLRLNALGLQDPIAIHPYATHPAKTPRPQVWTNMIRTLADMGHEIIVLGRNPIPLLPDWPLDLTNSTDLRTTSALLSLCRGLITGDSGPMHLAAAVGTPVVALFGPTTQEWGFFPTGPADIVYQSPCPKAPCSLHGQNVCPLDNACMAEISPAKLIDLVSALPESSRTTSFS